MKQWVLGACALVALSAIASTPALAATNSILRIEACPGCKCEPDELSTPVSYAGPAKEPSHPFLECHSSRGLLECISKSGPPAEVMCPLESSSHSCDLEDPATLASTASAPAGCKYGMTAADGFHFKQYVPLVQKFVETGKIGCDVSMCTSAAFLAFVGHLKSLRDKGRITPEKFAELSSPEAKPSTKEKPFSESWELLNIQASPGALLERFGLGKSDDQGPLSRTRKEFGAGGIPKTGDLVNLWRKNNSGHSVVFRGFLFEPGNPKPTGICYWSTQKLTDGYGTRCESLEVITKMNVGSFND